MGELREQGGYPQKVGEETGEVGSHGRGCRVQGAVLGKLAALACGDTLIERSWELGVCTADSSCPCSACSAPHPVTLL